MRNVNVRKLISCATLAIATVLLYSCTSKELSIQIVPKSTPEGYDMFYFVNEEGRMHKYGGLTKSIAGLKIDGKDVISVTIVDMGANQKGLYFAFSEEQKPKTFIETDIYGQTTYKTIYDGGTTLASGSKWKYSTGFDSLNIIVR